MAATAAISGCRSSELQSLFRLLSTVRRAAATRPGLGQAMYLCECDAKRRSGSATSQADARAARLQAAMRPP